MSLAADVSHELDLVDLTGKSENKFDKVLELFAKALHASQIELIAKTISSAGNAMPRMNEATNDILKGFFFGVRENRKKRVVRDGFLDPEKAVKAWYQVRSNLTHRGKAAFKENRLLLTATIDLYNTLFFFLGDEVPGLIQQWGNHVQYMSRHGILR